MNIINYSEIKFKLREDGYCHNLDYDFSCFALWKTARKYRDRIRTELSKRFEVLLETEIEWSEKNFHKNAERLYEVPMFSESKSYDVRSSHGKKIGTKSFVIFILLDKKPKYTYAKSVSGKIELSNLNFVEMKYLFRDWIESDTGLKFGVHSTNNIYEFYYQVPLLLGTETFYKLIKGEKLTIDKIVRDLEGSDGWNSWQDVFKILNLTNNYLVLRGFEELPLNNSDKDLDVLTDNYQRFASALGATQKKKQPYKAFINVNNEIISIDIRFVGDNYYQTAWAKEMLITKTQQKDLIFVPRKDHYFFSLFFHAKVQKKYVKSKYFTILQEIATELDFNWYSTEILKNNTESGKLLSGYFLSNGYYYKAPLDRGVYENKEVVKELPVTTTLLVKPSFKSRLIGIASKVLPEPLKDTIKKNSKLKRIILR